MRRGLCPRLGLAWFGCLALACSDEGPYASATPTPAATQQGSEKASKGGVDGASRAEVSTFSYSPVGRRDPFRSYLTQVKERQDARGQDHRREATENFEVNQFRLTGLVTGTSQPKAMVDDPNGDAHVLRIGSRMGKNGGRVYSIGAHGITVVEEVVDASGKLVSVPIDVRLPQDASDDVAPRE